MKNPVVVIAGPTASGKSQLAIDVAAALNGVILNADASQIYQGTPIISAVPTFEDKQRVEHRLYELFPNNMTGSVIEWLNKIVPEIRSLWAEKKLPVVVGGTGLYIDNLINGTTPVPETSPTIRKKVATMLEKEGVNTVYAKLTEVDKESAQHLNPNDTTRVRRAYEVWLDTGKPLSEWHKIPMLKRIPEADFFVIKIIPSQKELDDRCFERFDKMMSAGALQEAEKLYMSVSDRHLPAMKALGVPELLAYFDGKSTLEEAVALAKLHTRQYAKRQLTWFKHKTAANMVLDSYYQGEAETVKNVIFNVKNYYKGCTNS